MPMPITDTLDRLRGTLAPLVRSAGITDIAEKIGVSRPALHRWLSGGNAIGESKVFDLAQLFGYEVVIKIKKIR